jgi:threonine dehydratase
MYPSMRHAAFGDTERRFSEFSIADGIAIYKEGKLTTPVLHDNVSRIELVGEPQLVTTILMVAEISTRGYYRLS